MSTSAQFAETTPWIATTSKGWVVGRGGAVVATLPAPIPGSEARLDWGRLTIAVVQPDDTWHFLVGSLDGSDFKEVFSKKGFQAEVQATVDPAGRTLFYSVGTGTGTDGGVYAVDLATGTETVLVAPGPAADPSSRVRLEWSPSGAWLASSLCSFETCAVDLIDPVALTARRLKTAMALSALSDGYALGTDGTHGGWLELDLKTGVESPVAANLIADANEGWALPDESFVISGWTTRRSDGTRDYVIATASPGGTVSTVLSQPEAGAELLQRLGSSDQFVAIGPAPADALDAGGGKLDVLDLSTASISSGAMSVGP